MRTARNMIAKIGELMGREGSEKQAEALFAVLLKKGYISFNWQYGYDWTRKGE